MLTVEDVRYEVYGDDIPEERILRAIKRGQDFIRGYTNNPLLFIEDNGELDEPLLYLVSSYLNEDTRGRQGLTSEGIGGASFGFSQDLPKHIKTALSKHRRARTL